MLSKDTITPSGRLAGSLASREADFFGGCCLTETVVKLRKYLDKIFLDNGLAMSDGEITSFL
jgi:hypothetical protein